MLAGPKPTEIGWHGFLWVADSGGKIAQRGFFMNFRGPEEITGFASIVGMKFLP